MRSRPMSGMVALVVLGVTTAGCAAQSGDPAADRARHFYAAIGDEDAAAACADLAPEARKTLEQQEGKACEEAILGLEIPDADGSGSAEIYGSMAQVAYENETAFLSRYGDDWLLTAVGCPPVSGDKPHDCAIEVG
jgi:hypothetical protein